MARKQYARKRRRGDPYRVVLSPFAAFGHYTRKLGGPFVLHQVTTSKGRRGRHARKHPGWSIPR